MVKMLFLRLIGQNLTGVKNLRILKKPVNTGTYDVTDESCLKMRYRSDIYVKRERYKCG